MPLKTAKDFASAAANMGQMATAFKPEDNDPYRQLRELIRFHLQTAAMNARRLAEALAQKEAQE
jgi:hypothetical protein